jgi:hypothetical protein
MWNLSGDDIQRAKEELKGRRDAIKAHYDKEMKQLEADIAAIETFERAAVDFVSNFKSEDRSAAVAPDSAAAPEKAPGDGPGKRSGPASLASVAEESVAAKPAAEPVPEPAPDQPEPAAAEKSSSRWRMRLSATEGGR